MCAATATPQTPSASTSRGDFSNIRNFFRVNGQFCTGGPPSRENLEKMKAQGVRLVVNLRLASEYNFEEEAATAKLDLRYFHIPVDKNNLKGRAGGGISKSDRRSLESPHLHQLH